MSSSQELPLTGASTAAVGAVGALALGLGAVLVTVAQWARSCVAAATDGPDSRGYGAVPAVPP
ncbi:hypothetical protein, partial [Micromonospora sp. KC213]|uniref:hypothetical protein n=1 Tax=Micromonospora sp. KC213 TaxID=2530378 RepID=UPI001A9D9AC7